MQTLIHSNPGVNQINGGIQCCFNLLKVKNKETSLNWIIIYFLSESYKIHIIINAELITNHVCVCVCVCVCGGGVRQSVSDS